MGRPSKATPEVVDAICDAIASGAAIRDIASKDGFPSESTIYAKMAADEDFRSRIARAREAQQDYEADNCVHMADEATADDWQVVKMRIWARQWRASKLAPKRYGDKLALTDGDGKALAAPMIQVTYIEAPATRQAITAPDE